MNTKKNSPAWLRSSQDGCILHVKVSPGAKKTRILSFSEESPWIKIAIHAPPEKGKANEALLSFLSEILDVPMSDCSLVKGATASLKQVFIRKQHDDILHLFTQARDIP